MQPLKLGIIGTGSVVREIYRHLYFHSDFSPMLSVEAICDTSPENLREFGDLYRIPTNRRFLDYQAMCDGAPLDVVQVNTPDAFHAGPVCFALERGLDVLVPKPLADKIVDAYAMLQSLEASGRFMGVDFHKREDPRIKEAKARYQRGDYGTVQSSVWYMLDKLLVADPNHRPRFFATDDFAVKNTPVSFLTVHMADAFMVVTGLKPIEVQAVGFKQKLPSLSPVAVDGYDLVDTEVVFENGAVAHFITGWALPNSAHATTVQSARLIGSDGLLDLALDRPGYHEVIADGIFERNPLFLNFESDGMVSGYGISSPGRIFRQIMRFRNHELPDDQRQALLSPVSLGFYTTVICEAAHLSLVEGQPIGQGVTRGKSINVSELLKRTIGKEGLG
jgi:predicted dehydrogenase